MSIKSTYSINGLQFDDYYLVPEERKKFGGYFQNYQTIHLVYSSDKILELYLSKSILTAKKTKEKEFEILNHRVETVQCYIDNFIDTKLKKLNLTNSQVKKLNIVLCNFLKKKALRELYRKTKRIVFEEVLTKRRDINNATHPAIEKRIVTYAKNSGIPYLKQSLEFLELQNKIYFNLNRVLSKKKKIFIAATSKSSLLEYQLCFGLKEVIRDEKKQYFSDLMSILNELRNLSPQLFKDLPYIDEPNIRKAIERGSYKAKNEKRLKSPSTKNYDNYRIFKIEHWGISILKKVS